MNYTSEIKNILKKESFNTKDGATMYKYIITFINGHNPNYYTTKDLTFNVGDVVSYELDQAKNKCKILSNDTQGAKEHIKQNYSNPKDDIQRYIIRQSSLNRATDLWGNIDLNNYDQDVKLIIELANKFENYVYNGK